jgi:hypothetical protein
MEFPNQLPKISDQTVRLIRNLSDDTRAQVAKVVKTHLAACARNGSPIESLDRLFIEAVEVINMEARFPEQKSEFSSDWEPFRRYEQYVSPREL